MGIHSCISKTKFAQLNGQPWGPLLHDKILSSGWALQAALEDRALEGQETSSDATLPALKNAPPSTEPSPSLGNLKTPDATSGLKLPSFTLQPDSIKVRVARNSEELKAVAALRVSIFQHFLNPKEKAEQNPKLILNMEVCTETLKLNTTVLCLFFIKDF